MASIEDALIIAIDQGTTSSRVITFTARGAPITIVQRKHAQITAKPGYLEHNPSEIVSLVGFCLEETAVELTRLGYNLSNVKSISITNQRETFVLWNKKTHLPIYNAVVWSDTRSKPIVEKMSKDKELSAKIIDKTGLPLATYFSAPKVNFLRDTEPSVDKAFKSGNVLFGTIDCWLIYNLTDGAVFATDTTNACRTLLFNINRNKMGWDEELCSMFNVPMECLPKVQPSCSNFGCVAHGPFKGVPIYAVAGDQMGSLFGHMLLSQGVKEKATFGTGAFLLKLFTAGGLQKPPKVLNDVGLLSTIAFDLPTKYLSKNLKAVSADLPYNEDSISSNSSNINCLSQSLNGSDKDIFIEKNSMLTQSPELNKSVSNIDPQEDHFPMYAIEGSIASAGMAFDWLRSTINMYGVNDMEKIDIEVPMDQSIGGLIFVPSFSGLFCPRWRPDSRAVILGITQYTKPQHLVRACFDSIALQLVDVMKCIQDAAEVCPTNSTNINSDEIKITSVDGGLTKSKVFLQVLANVTNTNIIVPKMCEVTALGVAMMAALECGIYKDMDDIYGKLANEITVYKPNYPEEERQKLYLRWERAIERSLDLADD